MKSSNKAGGTVNFTRFLKYKSRSDKVLMVFGIIGAVCAGILLPSISLVMGEVTSAFGQSASREETLELMASLAKVIIVIAIAIFICGYVFFAFW